MFLRQSSYVENRNNQLYCMKNDVFSGFYRYKVFWDDGSTSQYHNTVLGCYVTISVDIGSYNTSVICTYIAQWARRRGNPPPIGGAETWGICFFFEILHHCTICTTPKIFRASREIFQCIISSTYLSAGAKILSHNLKYPF